MTTPTDMPAKIRHVHDFWCVATGQQLRLGICDAFRERAWFDFIQAGFTEHDVLAVVTHLRREIGNGTRNPGALKFSNMIAQLDRFEEDLEVAKATARNRKTAPTPRERVLEQARPTVVPMTPKDAQITAKPVGELIAELRRSAGMQ
jgi:hypothetical protein